VDLPRCVAGADEDILRTLEAFGFRWDGPVMYQSARTDAYETALDRLKRGGFAYACSCSRRDVGDAPYPGTCRNGVRDPGRPVAWRVRAGDNSGDFVVRRTDGFFAYQLAVVVDDAEQAVTHVVRGADLLDSTPRQMWLQKLLGYRTPRYAHVPVATGAAGEKLSKQTLAPPLNCANPEPELRAAFRFLGLDESLLTHFE
jgi:glutamyl-Q tRNA(Asp) synthetase